MKLLSYCLFTPKKMHDHRFWDEHKSSKDRYWYNLPALYLANSILYPEYKMRVYVNPEIINHKCYYLLEELHNNFDNFQFEFVEEDYSSHEPAVWRIKPLWEEGCEIFMSRDIDSMPNESEFRSFKVFERGWYAVHTIRSHENHYQYPCRMLIGLSAFKPNLIDDEIKTESYESFLAKYRPENRWDGDQLTIIGAFTTNPDFTANKFLDSKIDNQKSFQDFYCNTISPNEMGEIELTEHQRKYFSIVRKHRTTYWAGRPCDTRGDFIKKLLKILPNEKLENILNTPHLKEFYKL